MKRKDIITILLLIAFCILISFTIGGLMKTFVKPMLTGEDIEPIDVMEYINLMES